MSRRPRPHPDALFAARPSKKILPFDFVLTELDELGPYTRPMFGCHAVYVDDRIIFILRDKSNPRDDDGVWVATTREHHEALKRELPSLRSITVLAGGGVTSWQILPADSDDFETSVLRACEMVRRGDPRIGKIPGKRGGKAAKKKAGKKADET